MARPRQRRQQRETAVRDRRPPEGGLLDDREKWVALDAP
jgi:hypothetical protein